MRDIIRYIDKTFNLSSDFHKSYENTFNSRVEENHSKNYFEMLRELMETVNMQLMNELNPSVTRDHFM